VENEKMGIFWIILISILQPAHDFHVSIAQAEWDNELVKCTIRVFSNDLEMVLQEEYGEDYLLESALEDQRMGEYIKSKFGLNAEGKDLKGQFIGLEIDYDLSYIFLEFPLKKAPKTLEITNSLFFDYFEDQSNIVNVQIESILRSAFLSPQKYSQILEF
jgi:hypothetical protein